MASILLVMDDKAPIRTWLPTVLQSAGYGVLEATSGREGLRMCRQRPIDLVIVDMLMPKLNGLETIMELTREFLHVKVITISEEAADHAMLRTAKLFGVRQTLFKPFGIVKMLNAVQYELAR